ncbi:MAG TPA: hypothetical protein VGL35_07435 [Rhizomicrobium sp.]
MRYRPPIRSDGYGYYAYLPAVFIDHDLTMKTPLAYRWTVVGKHPLPYNWTGIERYERTGRMLDKYTSGTALLQAPFFVVANAVAQLLRLPPYSAPYQFASVLSALSFFAVGTYLLVRLLMTRFSTLISVISAAAVVFGTNVFHFVTFAGSFSHVYSFFLVTVLLTIAFRYRVRDRTSSATNLCVAMGSILGLVALTRVPNIIVAAIPLALVSEHYYKTRISGILVREILAGIAAFLVVFSLQLAYWHAATGHFLVNSYQREGFNWLRPQVLNFLFSLKKGLFVWAPVLLIAVLGFPCFVKFDKVLGIAFLAVLSLEVYVCSSWWSWWFGGPFGSRPFVDMMPLIAFPLAYGFEWLGGRVWRFAPVSIIVLSILLNLFLMLSYWNELLPSNVTSAGDLLRLPARWKTHALLLPQVLPRSRALDEPYALGTPFIAAVGPPAGMWVEGFEPTPSYDHDLRLEMTFASNGALLTARHPRQRALVQVNGVSIGVIPVWWRQFRSDARHPSPFAPEQDNRSNNLLAARCRCAEKLGHQR